MIATKESAFYLTKPIIASGLAGGLGLILTIGLLSGLVFRPNNCIVDESEISTLIPGK
jgi:hypothetical protein